MDERKEFGHQMFGRNPRFAYLRPKDRYLARLDPPRHHFNVIGTGINGQEQIRVSQLEGRATTHGVFDPNPGSIAAAQALMAQLAPGQTLKVYETLEAACNDPAADGLIISTPNHTHLDVVRTAVKSGKHILLEKPMATTLNDAYEIARLATSHPARFQVGLQYRFKPMYSEAIHEALERGMIGDIKTISILEHRVPFLDKVGQWNKFSELSGGTLVEKCCHYFDLFNLFARSRPMRVFASGSQAVNFKSFEYAGKPSDILDNAFVTVEYANGVRANFNLCMFAPMIYEEIVLCGDAGRIKGHELEHYRPGIQRECKLEVITGADRVSRISEPSYPKHVEESGHHGGTYIERARFIDGIEGKPVKTASVSEGFWSIVIGVAAEASVKSGQVVDIASLLKQHGVNPAEIGMA